LDKAHVQSLEHSLRASVRRTERADRLRVGMSRSSFESCLIHTVQEFDKAAQEDPNVKTYTVDDLRTAIEQAFFSWWTHY